VHPGFDDMTHPGLRIRREIPTRSASRSELKVELPARAACRDIVSRACLFCVHVPLHPSHGPHMSVPPQRSLACPRLCVRVAESRYGDGQ
jgi:hypothetical protein